MSSALLDGFIEHSHRQPTAPALIWRGEAITYGELHAMASQAYDELVKVENADRPVGILAKKSPQSIALIIGCLMTGRRFLMPSVDLGETILKTLLERAGCADVFLSTSHYGSKSSMAGVIHATTQPEGDAPKCPDGTSFMLTTSGSTGLPKIVPLSAVAVDRFTEWAGARFDIRPGRTVLNYAPLSFDLCLLDIWTTLRYGGCVALVDQDQATNGSYLVDLLERQEVHVVQAVPLFYRLLIDATGSTGQRFPAVDHVIVTGDSIPTKYLAELPYLFDNASLYNLYGCTETNDSFIHEISSSDICSGTALSIGRPLPGVSALVVTDDDDLLTGSGTGELWVSTPFQTAGYLDQSLNDGKFLARDDESGPRTYFRTGDFVRRHDDGTTTLEGRRDFYVKVRGLRVNTQEIEQIILEHDEVVEAAVIAVPDEMVGKRLHAIVRRRTAELNSLTLRRHCAARLPAPAIPSTIDITDSALAFTATGKVDRTRIQTTNRRESGNGMH